MKKIVWTMAAMLLFGIAFAQTKDASQKNLGATKIARCKYPPRHSRFSAG